MTELQLPDDYLDLLAELNDAGAEYVLVGGWAVAVHGYGRATDDMDVLVRPTPENAERVFTALKQYGAPLQAHGIDEGLFTQPRYGYRMGRKPLLVEILTTIDGVTFDEAIHDAVRVQAGDLTIPVIGRSALIANKIAAGRPKDLVDVAALGNDDADC